jgi:catechol 2,3-dioxygenase
MPEPMREPILDIAHLGHIELLTPKFEASARFFIEVLGMTESGRAGDSLFLRGWDDYERYSLKLTASKSAGPTAISATARPSSARTPTVIRSSFITRPSGTRRRRI